MLYDFRIFYYFKPTKHSKVEIGDFPDTCSISHTFTQPYIEKFNIITLHGWISLGGGGGGGG